MGPQDQWQSWYFESRTPASDVSEGNWVEAGSLGYCWVGYNSLIQVGIATAPTLPGDRDLKKKSISL